MSIALRALLGRTVLIGSVLILCTVLGGLLAGFSVSPILSDSMAPAIKAGDAC